MTELDIYKFVTDNEIEFHWHDDNVIAFVYIWHIEEFNKLIGSSIMDEEGVKCTMKDRYFCFWMKDICEYHGIELEKVFPKK